MSNTSNSPTVNRVLNSTAELKRFDATEIRSLTLDEIDFVAGGKVQHRDFSIVKLVDAATPKFF